MAVCPDCGGSGKCSCCDGTGVTKDNVYPSLPYLRRDGSGTSTCVVCNGSGKCIDCNGSGRI